MVKKLPFVFFLLIKFFAFSQETYVPDDNFEAYLESIGAGNYIDNDNLVLSGSIAVITDLDISGLGISDLTGIEDFTALTDLTAISNSLTSLDLTANTNLLRVNVSDNNLTSFDFRNGMNGFIQSFDAIANYNLTCITVDDVSLSSLVLWNVDAAITSFSEDCVWTNVLDDNFENYLETHDANGNLVSVGDVTSMGNGIANDDYVTTAKISSVTSLDISSKMIADITGIEDFTALEILDFSTNGVGDFDLSNNTTLKELYCASNGMSSIDIAANVNLEILDCSDNSNTNINVSTNVKLKELNISTNGATSLNLGNITTLENLNVSNNDLTSLNLGNLSSLTDLNCSVNYSINAIDFTGLTSLVHLTCNEMGINSIDLRSNTALETLSINRLSGFDVDLSNNTALTSLSANSSDLTSLNVQNGNNANITSFDARFNQFTCIQVDDADASYLSGWQKDNTTSFEEDCSETNILDENFEYHLENHDANGNVVAVGSPNSMGNGIVDDGKVLTSRIKDVTFLNISGNSIDELDGLEAFISLEILDCSDNNFNEFDFSQLPELKELYIHDLFFAVLNLSSNLKIEKLIYNNANSTTLNLGNNVVIKELDIGGNNITSFDVSPYTTLEVLNIADNYQIIPINVRPLTNLKNLNANNTSLRNLDVSQNTLLETLDMDFASGFYLDLSANTALTRLSVRTSDMSGINIQNGNNANITYFDAEQNSATMNCIQVDDPTAGYLTSWEVDGNIVFRLDCSETNVPDDNFENYLETHDADNNVVSVGDPTSLGNGIANDNKVYTSNIENVTRLFIAYNSIANLTGLEDFINLEELFCFGNVINTSLDLTSLTKLERFQGGDMGLTSINVTDLTSLYELDAPRNTLTSVNVSTNPALTRLILSNNDLTGVDVSTNALLEDLQVHETTLTSVDVTNNPLLTRLTISLNNISNVNIENNPLLENFTVSRNPLTDIDVSHLVNLEDFSINNTNITSIDLSNNNKLIEVYMDECPNLSYVNVKNGANSIIEDFEVDNNPSLNCIEVDDPTAGYLTNWTKDVTTSFAEYCRFTYVPDDNFENYLETHQENTGGVPFGDPRSLGNGVMDDLVPTEKIENLTILFIEEEGISDFTGLEDFVALERFRGYGNPVNGTLDLTANTNLNQVFCWNMGLTDINITGLENLLALAVNENNLDSIDISTNINLEDVVVYDNNLTSLDVTLNRSLIGLNYVDNAITTIDLTQNSNLKFLYCNNNGVIELNLQGTPLIETLELSNNPISSLDVSGLANLVNLDFSNTSIASIDVSNNLDLSRLECNDSGLISLDVTNNTALRTLNTQNNSITALDLGNNTNLNALNASNNQLTYVNLKSGATDDISTVDTTNNPDLTCIEVDDPSASYLNTWSKDITANFAEYCRFTSVPDANFEAYLETHAIYGNNTALGNANSLGNGIIDDGLVPTEKLEEAQFLYLSDLGITDFKGLEDCVNVTRLFIGGNTISSLDVTANTKLDRLFAANMGLTSLSITGLTELTQLELNNNQLSAIDVSEFTNLSELYITDNNLSELNISVNNLTYLDISNNTISTIDLSGQTDLQSFKCDGTTITTLNFDNNTNLETLSFSNTSISSIDVTGLVNLRNLTFNTTNISEIDLSKNTDMSRLFCDETPLTFLDLRYLITLDDFSCKNGQLTNLNLKNGNASDLNNVDVTGNPGLTCIEVDDPLSADITGWLKDATASYAEFCRLTYVPDDVFENFLENNGYGNGIANDDYVSTSLVEVSESILFRNNTASDLTGIEDFRDLEFLVCTNTNLSTIDLSSNKKLTNLFLENNSLTNLDVSNNTELERLVVDNNQLGSLDITNLSKLRIFYANNTGLSDVDITNNLALTNIRVGDNELTNLDLSSLPNLIHVYVPNNMLESLNVANGGNYFITVFDATGNPDLTCIQVDDPLSSDITSWLKDATANYSLYCELTYIPDANFENYLETHDASGNIVALGDVTSLGNGIIDDNQVPTSKIKVVTTLDIDRQNIADLTGIEDFIALESLDCSYNDLTVLDVSNNVNLTILDAPENNFTTLDFTGHPSLEEIYLRSNFITSLLIDNNPTLKKLNAGKNGLTTLDVTSCTQLEELAVHENLLEQLDVRNGNNNLITDFFVLFNPDLSCIQVDDSSAAYLATWEKDDMASFSEDCVAPVITLTGANPQEIELGSGYTELGATTDDGSMVSIDSSDFVDAVGQYTIRYNATDASGNMATEFTRTVNVVDTTAPIITLTGANPQEIELGSGYTELGATTDDGSMISIDSSDFVDAVGQYTITYNATDASGNMAVEVTRTVNVVDTTAPVITLTGANPQEIELGSGYTELGATTDDGSMVAIDSSDFVDAVGQYTIRYNATDASGNMAIEVTRTVNVVDTTAPVITLTGANPQEIELGSGYTELGATTDDGSMVSIDSSDFVDAVGQYTIRYNATDASGNMAIEVTRTVNVVDTTAPVITLTGANPQEIELGSGYTELGATTDDGSIVTIDSSDFVDAVGQYTIRYNAKDASGNMAVEVTRTVNVVDTTAPAITLTGANPQEIELGSGYTELGATTDDGSMVSIDSSDFVDAVGQYTIRYNAKDASGNMAIEVTRTVNVVDTTAPVITLTGANPQEIELGSGYTELGATTDDGSMVTIDSSDFVDAVGQYTIRYNATDASGNMAIEVTRTVNVVPLLGISDQELVEVFVAPNPANYQFEIAGLKKQETTIFMYDFSGKLVKYIKQYMGGMIDIRDLSSGVYFVKLDIPNSKTYKLMKN
ncbi:immunoglobulin-like domain-containing protein [Aquimarina litoralis]|uniref:immunoglobulin-like domain-containing protein n=1 Tax=Aquimarina litoralis TaxID=584605 RepID=UPI001C56552F|nr:immunoglobulin-like domain-containing protein [Aquimarina litoralis]MBW1298455.1 DUF5011 domain-containing protein [Aquimarina litoralis]